MLLDLDFKFMGLDGKELTKDTAAKALASALAGKTADIPPIKAMDWAHKLYNEGKIEIDRSDADLLEAFVLIAPFNEAIGNLLKTPLLLAIKDLKAKE